MKKLFLLLVSLLVLVACHHDTLPEGVLSEDLMTDFLTEAYIVAGNFAIETQYRYDVLYASTLRSYDSILDRHGITREQVERSFDYYSQHLDAYQSIHDSVVARLEARQADAK